MRGSSAEGRGEGVGEVELAAGKLSGAGATALGTGSGEGSGVLTVGLGEETFGVIASWGGITGVVVDFAGGEYGAEGAAGVALAGQSGIVGKACSL